MSFRRVEVTRHAGRRLLERLPGFVADEVRARLYLKKFVAEESRRGDVDSKLRGRGVDPDFKLTSLYTNGVIVAAVQECKDLAFVLTVYLYEGSALQNHERENPCERA